MHYTKLEVFANWVTGYDIAVNSPLTADVQKEHYQLCVALGTIPRVWLTIVSHLGNRGDLGKGYGLTQHTTRDIIT